MRMRMRFVYNLSMEVLRATEEWQRAGAYYEVDEISVIIGRLVVLPDYRDHHLGSRVITEAEAWIKELKYKTILIDSRLETIGFYEKLGFEHIDDTIIRSGTFDCVRMKKTV